MSDHWHPDRQRRARDYSPDRQERKPVNSRPERHDRPERPSGRYGRSGGFSRNDRYSRDSHVKEEYGNTRHISRRSFGYKEEDGSWDRRSRNSEGNWDGNSAESHDAKPPPEKEKPNLNNSGLLAEETKKVNDVVVKYVEPQEGCMPDENHRYFLFKMMGENIITKFPLSYKSWYLIGRDETVCEVPIVDSSVSKQHAVIQFRRREVDDISKKYVVKPYVIDLGSTNGTFLARGELPAERYVELRSGDMLNFGDDEHDYMFIVDDRGEGK